MKGIKREGSGQTILAASRQIGQRKQEMEVHLERIQNEITCVIDEMKNIKCCFDFSGRDFLEKNFRAKSGEISDACHQLENHAGKLLKIARIYQEAEGKNRHATE